MALESRGVQQATQLYFKGLEAAQAPSLGGSDHGGSTLNGKAAAGFSRGVEGYEAVDDRGWRRELLTRLAQEDRKSHDP